MSSDADIQQFLKLPKFPNSTIRSDSLTPLFQDKHTRRSMRTTFGQTTFIGLKKRCRLTSYGTRPVRHCDVIQGDVTGLGWPSGCLPREAVGRGCSRNSYLLMLPRLTEVTCPLPVQDILPVTVLAVTNDDISIEVEEEVKVEVTSVFY